MRSLRRLLLFSLLALALAAIGSGFGIQERSSPENQSGTEEILRLNSIGVALMEQFDFQRARETFRQVLDLERDFVPGHVNLAVAEFNLQEYDSALASSQRALELDPDQIHAHYLQGLIFRNQDRPQDAIAAFIKVSRQDPDDPSTNYFLGLLHSRQKAYDEAIRYLRQVISNEPYNASAHYNLATALLRSGNRDGGMREMNEFRRLQGLFGTTTIGLQYLEQGKYSAAIDNVSAKYLPGLDQTSLEARVHVTFSEVGGSSGLDFKHAGPGRADGEYGSRSEVESRLVPYLGSGLAVADYDSDGWQDVFFANAGSSGAGGALFRNRGDGTFSETTVQSGMAYAGNTMAVVWGDFNNDEHPDLYLINYGPNVLYQNNGDGSFTDVTAGAGVGDHLWSMGGAGVDFDHDGDLDIFVSNLADPDTLPDGTMAFPQGLAGASNTLYRNNGDGTFSDVSETSHLSGGKHPTLGVLCADFDNSRDVDLYVLNLNSPNQLFSNLRDGTFTNLSTQADAVASQQAYGVAIGDIDNDGLVDMVLPDPTGGRTKISKNMGNGRFQSRSIVTPAAAVAPHNAQLIDFDNDGDLDVLLVASPVFTPSTAATFRNFYLLENQGGEFRDISEQVGLHEIGSLPVRGLAAADYDNDGDLDLAVNVNGSSPLLLRNDGGNSNNWLSVGILGTNSNRMGIGTKIEIKSGRLFQKAELYASSGFLSQSSPVIHFGLGKRSRLDMIRLLWPGGVLQSEIESPINQKLEFHELDRKGTSCPILYMWDGESYRFQTDFLGGSAYGYLLAPENYNHPDTDEYIKLDSEAVSLREGRVAITLNNQLEEVIFFDRLELVAVDHPRGYDIYPNEKLLPGPPYQEFRLFTASAPRPPVSASDGSGNNILAQISKIDRVYPQIFRELPFKGYADIHEMVLDIGGVSGDEAILIMQAWIDYADSTSNLAASQAGHSLIPPYLQVEDSLGRWVTVMERMGFPAGLPKTMTVDLSGKFLSASRKVRIVTNMRIYWDQILVESSPQHSDYRVHRLDSEKAVLRFRGFPEFSSPDGRSPKVYNYQHSSPSGQWKVHIGGYTRFGDVLPLLENRDDMFVITRSGDEIEAFFSVKALPKLPPGWTRDYLVYVDGFGKDMDINSASPDYIGPLPFHGMTSYPYGEGEAYPDDKAHRRYLRDWNTRIEERWIPAN